MPGHGYWFSRRSGVQRSSRYITNSGGVKPFPQGEVNHGSLFNGSHFVGNRSLEEAAEGGNIALRRNRVLADSVSKPANVGRN